jgi:protein-ribulosamine 3-kinase
MELAPLLEAAGLPGRFRSERRLGGGSIADVREITLHDSRSVVIKIGLSATSAGLRPPSGGSTCAHEEAAGLERLAETRAIGLPKVLGLGVYESRTVLVLERLSVVQMPAPSHDAWPRFGRALADLHSREFGSNDVPSVFGLDHDNHLGRTPQDNRPMVEWSDFFVVRRLAPMREVLRSTGRITEREDSILNRLGSAIPDLLPQNIRPSLIHGDLWSGNVIATEDRGIALIDPAVCFADPLFELGMMRLFGGFPAACLEAYVDRLRENRGSVGLEAMEFRIELGRLHHLLNHWLLFGREYAAQSISLASRLAG